MTRLHWLCAGLLVVVAAAAEERGDLRNIATGSVIPDEGYCDQPYVVVTKDGKWLCSVTTGKGAEGDAGQHIISTISGDQGKTWSRPVDIEPANGPEASWVMPLKVPSGRVYVFYTYNKDNVRAIPLDGGRSAARVDTLGAYVFKYSDDNGHTWSKERYEIPLKAYDIDRANNFLGKVLFFWGVGRPMIDRNTAYFGWAKVGKWWLVSEGMIMRSSNVTREQDPAKVRWEMLPGGRPWAARAEGGDRGGDQPGGAERRDAVRDVPHAGRVSVPCLQQGPGAHVDGAGVRDLFSGRPADQAPARGGIRLEDEQRQVSALVPQQQRRAGSRYREVLFLDRAQSGLGGRRRRKEREDVLVRAGDSAVRRRPEDEDQLSGYHRGSEALLHYGDAEDRGARARDRRETAGGAVGTVRAEAGCARRVGPGVEGRARQGGERV